MIIKRIKAIINTHYFNRTIVVSEDWQKQFPNSFFSLVALKFWTLWNFLPRTEPTKNVLTTNLASWVNMSPDRLRKKGASFPMPSGPTCPIFYVVWLSDNFLDTSYFTIFCFLKMLFNPCRCVHRQYNPMKSLSMSLVSKDPLLYCLWKRKQQNLMDLK